MLLLPSKACRDVSGDESEGRLERRRVLGWARPSRVTSRDDTSRTQLVRARPFITRHDGLRRPSVEVTYWGAASVLTTKSYARATLSAARTAGAAVPPSSSRSAKPSRPSTRSLPNGVTRGNDAFVTNLCDILTARAHAVMRFVCEVPHVLDQSIEPLCLWDFWREMLPCLFCLTAQTQAVKLLPLCSSSCSCCLCWIIAKADRNLEVSSNALNCDSHS